MARKRSKPEKWIVLPDQQVPYHDPRTLYAVNRYMADHKWTGMINLGDFLDFKELSSFEKKSKRDRKAGCIERQYDIGGRVLDEQLDALRRRSGASEAILLEGNHEARLEKYLDENPEAQGTVEVPVGLDLKKRRVEWIKSWSEGDMVKLGNAHFMHGRYLGINHARKTAQEYGVCTYYGHVHDVQLSSVAHLGEDKTIEAGSLGCLCRYDQQYMRGAPQKWQQAFAVFHIKPNGYYQRFIVRIFRHSFISPEGKEYIGR